MSYIGNQPTTTAFVTDQFSGTGSQTAFTMSLAPASTSSIIVAVTGVLQDPSTYSVSGTTLTFSAAPPSGTGNISVRYLGIPASGVTTTAYRTVTEFTATAGQTTFSVPSYTAGYIDVYRNGSRLGTADYTATSGTTVILVNPATAGDLVVTESFYVSSVLNAIPATAGAVNSTYITDAAVTQAKLGTNVVGNGPAFSAYQSSAQTGIANLTFTKMNLQAEEFDTASCFDNTTNYRFTPNVAGYYQVNGHVLGSPSAGGMVLVSIYKNGTRFKDGLATPNGSSIAAECVVSSLVYMNGSTDYVELYVFQSSGSAMSLQSNAPSSNYFQGVLARAA